MKSVPIATTLALALAAPALACADTVALRDGRVISGEFLGATSRSVQVRTDDGIRRLPIADVARVELDPRPEAAPAEATPDADQRVVIVGTGPSLSIERTR